MIQWHFEGPSASFGFWHTFNATVPIRMRLHSGMLEDVTTPAGTFSSIPVRVAVPATDRLATADREGPVVGLGGDECGRPRLAAEAWFSGDVGNVVKAVTFIGGVRDGAQVAAVHPAQTNANRNFRPSFPPASRGGETYFSGGSFAGP